MKYNLPRKYLSYSAYSLWKKNKDQFRQRYYEGEKPFETAETIFGKKIAKQLEQGVKINGVITGDRPEYCIEVELEPGLKLLGYLDNFIEKKLSVIEYKTGHKDPSGKSPWDQLKVRKHLQLVWYSLLVKIKHGRVGQWHTLQWLETRFAEKKISFEGHELIGTSKQLELTGHVQTFKRRIAQWERDLLIEDIKKVAREISDDYSAYIVSTEDQSPEKM